MPLGRRLSLLIVTLAVGLVLIAGATAWGVASLNRNLAAALGEYNTLRQLYDLGLELTRIDQALRTESDGRTGLRLATVRQQIDRLDDAAARERLDKKLNDADDAATQVRVGLNTVMGLVAEAKGRIRTLDDDARQQRRLTLAIMSALCVVTLATVGMLVRGQLRALDDQVRAKSGELARAERLASVGFLAAGVAHELNNPLAVIAGEAELGLRRASDDAAARQAWAVVRDEAFRGKAVTTKLLSLARSDAVMAEALQLADLGRDVAALAGRMARFADRRVEVEAREPVAVTGDRTLVTQVVLNLVVNALEASSPPSSVRVVAEGEGVSVIDAGRGMTTDEMARVFEPFYTSKRGSGGVDGESQGLGLSISHAVVQRMGGTLAAASDGPGLGSRFTLTLPRAKAKATP